MLSPSSNLPPVVALGDSHDDGSNGRSYRPSWFKVFWYLRWYFSDESFDA
jgi:hypothetical protein